MTEENGAAISDQPVAPPAQPQAPPPAPPVVTPPAKTGGRPFDPELAENTLTFPGMAEYIDQKFGITQLKVELARSMVVSELGLSKDAAARLTGTPEQIVSQAQIIRDEIAKATAAQTAAVVTDGQPATVTPPAGNPAQSGDTTTASEFMRTMQQLMSGASPAAQATTPQEKALAEYRAITEKHLKG